MCTLVRPEKLRSKLDVRWRYGVFLGRSMSTDQNYIGVADGSVVGARAMVRIVVAKRWNLSMITAVNSLPMDIKTRGLDTIEAEPNPHDHATPLEQEEEEATDSSLARRRLRITAKDLKTHGYTASCPRCSLHQQGQHSRAGYMRHNETCRNRVYDALRAAGADKMNNADAAGDHRTKIDDPRSRASPNLSSSHRRMLLLRKSEMSQTVKWLMWRLQAPMIH